MKKVVITVTESNCRSGYFKAGDRFVVGDLCPPLCCELWSCIYPYVFALQNGAVLDCGNEKASSFDGTCPDGGRVRVHGELFKEQR